MSNQNKRINMYIPNDKKYPKYNICLSKLKYYSTAYTCTCIVLLLQI